MRFYPARDAVVVAKGDERDGGGGEGVSGGTRRMARNIFVESPRRGTQAAFNIFDKVWAFESVWGCEARKSSPLKLCASQG